MKLQILMVIFLHILSESTNAAPLAPALYVFGDSLLDSGNNNYLVTAAKADYLPYGMSFAAGPTGRFTDGRTVADFIAEFLGLPYPKPYLSILRRILQPDQLIKGLNFASAACGILPETGARLGKCLNLAEQIGFFDKTVKEQLPKHFDTSEQLSDYLSQSVFLISIGSNDYINNYLDTRQSDTSTRARYTPQSFAALLVRNLSQQFQRLYGSGARKVVMFEIGPLGCMPSSTRTYRHNGTCVEDVNELAIIFNAQLAPMLQELTASLPGSSFVIGRVHSLGYDAAVNPAKYGLSDTSNPCCVAWWNGTLSCIPVLGGLTCQHPEDHYFFDGYHLTETLYKTIATLCFNHSSLCTPNIQQLISQP